MKGMIVLYSLGIRIDHIMCSQSLSSLVTDVYANMGLTYLITFLFRFHFTFISFCYS